ncbi:hypothetical protein SAMN05428970_0255 [Agromyces sp. CF514]|uniref:hypothetical protein n=1 Tax=Agromyces sp. CF514 TaxID=1881031 RepID=UPI0008EAECA9|nr:hypothetical protein [Agromyces sp. CF514]SFR67689.1 hypothetical protein SAMN05428970_0255 [Agromyces sp. CF514]
MTTGTEYVPATKDISWSRLAAVVAFVLGIFGTVDLLFTSAITIGFQPMPGAVDSERAIAYFWAARWVATLGALFILSLTVVRLRSGSAVLLEFVLGSLLLLLAACTWVARVTGM